MQREVARVPRLGVVARDVLLLVVALARVDKAVIEPPPLVEQREDGRAAVPGDVGNLVAVVGVGRVGDVDGLLIGVLELGSSPPVCRA